jgi:hypothetical protein
MLDFFMSSLALSYDRVLLLIVALTAAFLAAKSLIDSLAKLLNRD